MKVNFRAAGHDSIDAMLDDAVNICGAIKDGAITVFPRRDDWPGVLFSPMFIGDDGKLKQDALKQVITLLIGGAWSISVSAHDQARRLALARHIVDEAHRVYAISLREWEKS